MLKNKLTLRDVDVAKCVPKGVTHLDFSHDESMLLVASGDKEGHIGLWRVDEMPDEEDEDGDDGVLYYRAHGAYISHCKWGHGALRGKLFTCAYDGAVRVLDPQAGAFQETVYSEEDEFSVTRRPAPTGTRRSCATTPGICTNWMCAWANSRLRA